MQASNTLNEPQMLTSNAARGKSWQWRSQSAARWKTPSALSRAERRTSVCMMSPPCSKTEHRGSSSAAARFSRVPRTKLSYTTTSPTSSWRSASVTCEPISPAPPTTTNFLPSSFTGRDDSGALRDLGKLALVLRDAPIDEIQVLARPGDRAAQPVLERRPSYEAELALGLLGAAEAQDRVIPRPGRRDLELRARTAQLDDQLRELADRRLDAARQVVDIAGLAALGTGQEAACDILDVDEVARGHAAVVELHRQALESAVDEGRRDVPPDRRRCAAPPARAEHLAGPEDVLEPRSDGRQAVLAVVVDGIELAHDLRDLVRAVEVQGHRPVFRYRLRAFVDLM